MTKRAVLRFIGKKQYTFGDITRTVVGRLEAGEGGGGGDQTFEEGLPYLFAKEAPIAQWEVIGKMSSGFLPPSGKSGTSEIPAEDDVMALVDSAILLELETWDATFQERMDQAALQAYSEERSSHKPR